jgi:hypothetical protein
MAAQVLYDHDVTGPQGPEQLLTTIGAEAFLVDWAVEDAWCGEFVAA